MDGHHALAESHRRPCGTAGPNPPLCSLLVYLGQSLHSISRHKQNASCILFVHFVEKGQFTFDISPNVLLAKRLVQTFCIFRTKCSGKRLEPNNSHARAKRFAQTLGPMAVKRNCPRSGPGPSRPGVPGGVQKNTPGQRKVWSPHWNGAQDSGGQDDNPNRPMQPSGCFPAPPLCIGVTNQASAAT